LSHHRHITPSHISPIDQQMDLLVGWMSKSPIALSQRLIEWTATSTDNIPTCDELGSLISASLRISEKSLLLPYMNFIRPSKWYHQLLNVAITSLRSRLSSSQSDEISNASSSANSSSKDASTSVTWCLPPPPSRVYRCNCHDCNNLHSFIQSSNEKYHFRAVIKRRHHVQETINVERLDTIVCSETLHQGSPHTLVVTKLR
jgi:hypothetical protein